MVKIAYCPTCEKANRFHIKKKLICNNCKSVLETVEVPRTKYYIIQFPLLIIGFIIICFSAFYLSIEREKIAEPFGIFILGLALLFFALAFQIMDNKQMEQTGKEIGLLKFGSKVEKDRITSDKLRISGAKDKLIKSEILPQKENVQVSLDQLFLKPNRPNITMKQPPKSVKKPGPVGLSKLSTIVKTKHGKKKARKIRKAI
jgi:hypothetical protein